MATFQKDTRINKDLAICCVTGSPWHTAVCVCEGGGDERRPTEQAQVPAWQQLSGGVARPPVQRRPFTAMWNYAIPSE